MVKFVRRALVSVLDLKQIEKNENENGWNLVHMTPARAAQEAREMIWSMGDDKNLVHYVEEPRINERYFLIEGENRMENLEKIAEVVPLYHPEELLEQAGKVEGKALIPLLPKLAVSAPQEKDEKYVKLFQQAVKNSDPDVRYEALVSMGFISWRDFERDIESAKKDEEKDIAALAGFLLESLRKDVWKAS